MWLAIDTITRFAKSPSMVSGPIVAKAQLKSFRTELRTRWGAWIGTIVGLLLVLLSWPVAGQTPFPVVTGLSNPSALALDGNYIYFGENPGSTGHLSRAPKTGGPREQLLTGKALHDSGSIVGILGIDFSPTHIYFGYGGYVNTLIEEVPRGGSTTRVLANLSGSSSAGRFSGVLGSNIYYFQNFCNLQRLGTAIGAVPVQVASCVWPRSTARDQNSLYFFDLHSLNVYRYDAGTVNSLVPLITGNASEGAVFLDSTNVYFAVGALVRKVAKLGGTVTNIALPAGGVMRQADDAFIYFTVGTQLWRQSSAGSGSAEIVSSGISISGDMVSDATFLYWADMSAGNGAGVINRLQKSGFLRFPLKVLCGTAPCTPFTANIASVMDHSGTPLDPTNPGPWYSINGKVKSYTGEVGEAIYGTNCTPGPGYKNATETNFIINDNYVGASCPVKAPHDPASNIFPRRFLNYDGHSGYDYPYPVGTPIVAPADGQLFKAAEDNINHNSECKLGKSKFSGWKEWHTFYIVHANGYSTWFLHASELDPVIEAQIADDYTVSVPVIQGQVVGFTGKFGRCKPVGAHLHFEVRKGLHTVVDPYSDKLWIIE